MPEVDLITIVKMVSKLVPRVELMGVVVVVGEVLKPKQKKKQLESIERSRGYQCQVQVGAIFHSE